MSDIESLAPVFDGQSNIPTVEAAVESVPQELFSELRCSNEAEMEHSGVITYYTSQSAKTFLREFFELKPPAHLDPADQTTSLKSSKVIQFAQAVRLEVTVASYGLLEDSLLSAGVGNHVGGGSVGGRRSLYPSQ